VPDTKYTGLPAATVVNAADQWGIAQSGASKSVTFAVLRSSVGAGLSNASVATVSAGYAADTYLAGSAITIPVAGGWKVSTNYVCKFDMVKTAAGTATFVITLRMGTLGTTGDAAITTLTFAAGTAAADTGICTVTADFRTVGAGTSAVIQARAEWPHFLAATGLHSTGASGYGAILATSAGFNSTTQTIIGLSVNGGASFSGTNTMVDAYALNI